MNKKYLMMFSLTIILCLSLVACSSDDSIYNENFTENPTYDEIVDYNIAIGDGLGFIINKSREELGYPYEPAGK